MSLCFTSHSLPDGLYCLHSFTYLTSAINMMAIGLAENLLYNPSILIDENPDADSESDAEFDSDACEFIRDSLYQGCVIIFPPFPLDIVSSDDGKRGRPKRLKLVAYICRTMHQPVALADHYCKKYKTKRNRRDTRPVARRVLGVQLNPKIRL